MRMAAASVAPMGVACRDSSWRSSTGGLAKETIGIHPSKAPNISISRLTSSKVGSESALFVQRQRRRRLQSVGSRLRSRVLMKHRAAWPRLEKHSKWRCSSGVKSPRRRHPYERLTGINVEDQTTFHQATFSDQQSFIKTYWCCQNLWNDGRFTSSKCTASRWKPFHLARRSPSTAPAKVHLQIIRLRLEAGVSPYAYKAIKPLDDYSRRPTNGSSRHSLNKAPGCETAGARNAQCSRAGD